MRILKIFQTIIGVIPFIWFTLFLIILVGGLIHLGEIPKYGNILDPDALGFGKLSYYEAIFIILSFISFFLWFIITVVIYVFFKEKIKLNKLSLFLFLIGIGGFFLFRYVFTEQFLWVVD
jgi:hypothetical protein